CVGLAEHIHLHRVVDDQFGGNQRIDLFGAAAELDYRIAHRGQVDHTGHAGEVLQDHARGHEGDFGIRFGAGLPAGDGLDVILADGDAAILVPEQVLQQDLHRVGQVGDVEALAQLGQAEVVVGLAADVQLAAGG